MARKLASIQRISAIEPIEGADLIVCATVLGWKVVVKKDEFHAGDLCVYCEVDSRLPAKPEFEFLAKAKYRIKTIKLRGQVSQGICFPVDILPDGDYAVGQDVTEVLGVVKYEPPLPRRTLAGDTKGSFPGYVPKTDEMRIQSVPDLLDELRGVHCYATVKIDGTSATFCRFDDAIDVCSRGRSVKEHVKYKNQDGSEGITTTVYWRMFRKYHMDELFKAHNHLAIQGEIAGFWDEMNRSAIQGNKLKLKESDLYVYNIFDIKEHRYYDFDEFMKFCAKWRLLNVPVDNYDFVLDHTVEELLKMAEGQYQFGGPREGLVIRPLVEMHSKVLKGRASFKAINNKFLLKHGE